MKATAGRNVISAFAGAMLAFASTLWAAEPGAAQPAAGGPRLVVAEPSADFGPQARGAKPTHTFVLRNEGDAPLQITRVLPACGCTVVDFDNPIAPGGEGKLTTEVDTLLLSGTGNTKVSVFTNDPAANPLVLTLAYEVQQSLYATPGQARWKSTQGEKEGTIGNTLYSDDGKDFSVVGVDSPHSYVRASFRPATEAERHAKATGPQWRVDLTLDSMAPPGAILGNVVVRTDHPDQQLLPLPISGFVRPTIYLFPEVGDFGAVDTSTRAIRASFKFTNFATEPIAVTAVELDIPGATATVEAVEAGREYKVAVVLPAGMPAGDFAGTLTVRTDSAKAPAITAPVRGVVTTAAASAAMQPPQSR
jgi:hypothetical protein